MNPYQYYVEYWTEPKGHNPQWVRGEALKFEQIDEELSRLRKLGFRKFRVVRLITEVMTIEQFEEQKQTRKKWQKRLLRNNVDS